MYASSTLFFAAVTVLARLAIAGAPPACFLAALGAQSNPADLKSLCGTLEPQMAGNITEKCSGSAESAAISVFSATCLASESVTITISSSSSGTNSVSATTSATGSPGSKTTGTAASTGSTGATASATSEKSSGSSLSPRTAFLIAHLVLAAGTAQYLV